MTHLLRIDDDPAHVRRACAAAEDRRSMAADGASGDETIRRDRPEVVLLERRVEGTVDEGTTS